jgi:hypothetical protein
MLAQINTGIYAGPVCVNLCFSVDRKKTEINY